AARNSCRSHTYAAATAARSRTASTRSPATAARPACAPCDAARAASATLTSAGVGAERGGELCLQATGHGAGHTRCALALAHWPNAGERAGEKDLARAHEVLAAEHALLRADAGGSGGREHCRSHDAGDAAAVHARGQEQRITDEKHVAHGARNECAGAA